MLLGGASRRLPRSRWLYSTNRTKSPQFSRSYAVIVPRSTKRRGYHHLWAWGNGEFGQLGLGSNKNESRPQLVEELSRKRFLSVSANWVLNFVVTDKHEVYSWGRGAWPGILQPGRKDSIIRIPSLCDPLSGRMWLTRADIVRVEAGRAHAVALDNGDAVYTWGMSELGQRGQGVEGDGTELWLPGRIEALCGKKIRQLAIGLDHCFALTSDGEVWSWGFNEDGQTGHDTEEQMLSVPRRLQTLPSGVEIVDVVCGSDFSALLTKEGRVLACGANHFGQLGVGDVDPRTTPAEVRMPADFRVVQVALGGSHMLLLTDRGEVYSCGWGQNGRLGHGNQEDLATPTLVAALRGERIRMVATGGGHNYALSDRGKLFTWGLGLNGRLGLGSEGDVLEPTLMDFDFGGKPLVQIVCGLDHTLAITED